MLSSLRSRSHGPRESNGIDFASLTLRVTKILVSHTKAQLPRLRLGACYSINSIRAVRVTASSVPSVAGASLLCWIVVMSEMYIALSVVPMW
jgi:hypothetical protein